jgi:hypothetical protein
MATRWRRRLAERSLDRRNKFIPRRRTWFVRFRENLIPTRCEQGPRALISTFWRPHFQRSPLARGSCSGMLARSNATHYYAREPIVERQKSSISLTCMRSAIRSNWNSVETKTVYRKLAAPLRHRQAPGILGLQTAAAEVFIPAFAAPCAFPTSCAVHASGEANRELTFALDQAMRADHPSLR